MRSALVALAAAVLADESPPCSCQCCDAVQRAPEEVARSKRWKCALNDTCPDSCEASPSGEPEEYAVFCFYQCDPRSTNGPSSCAALNKDQLALVTTSAGPVDPAEVVDSYAFEEPSPIRNRPRPVSLLRAGSNATRGSSPGNPTEEEREQSRQHIRVDRAKTRSNDALEEAEKQAERLRNKASRDTRGTLGRMITQAEAEESSASDIEEYVRRARRAAYDARRQVSKASSIAWKAAMTGAKDVFLGIKKKVEDKEAKDAALVKKLRNPEFAKMMKIMQEAAEPWFMQGLNAQASIRQYDAESKKQSSTSWTLYKSAKAIEKKANVDLTRGLVPLARAEIADAQDKFLEAQKTGKLAEKAFQTSRWLQQQLPQYQFQAQLAAAYAVRAATPNAPPPMPGPMGPPAR